MESTESGEARASDVSRRSRAYQGISLWIPFFFWLVDSVLLSALGALAGLDLAKGLVFFAGFFFDAAPTFNSVATAASVAVSVSFVGAMPARAAGVAATVAVVAADVAATVVVLELAEGGSTGGAVLLPGGVLEDSVGDTVSTLTVCPGLLPADEAIPTLDVVPPWSTSSEVLISPGGFKLGSPLCAAAETFGELLINPIAR